CGALEKLKARGLTVRSLKAEQVFLPGGLESFSPKLAGAGLTDFPTVQLGAPDASSDVQALGQLMFEALEGRTLQPGEEPFPEADLDPGTSHGVRRVVRRCPHIDPPARYSSASEVAEALNLEVSTTIAPVEPAPVAAPVRTMILEKEGEVLGNYRLVRLI